jgi:hypothetical protein
MGKHRGRCFQEVKQMLELDLDLTEREILSDVIETILADLRMEIGRTDRKEFREMLKKRKQVLVKILMCLRGEGPPSSDDTLRQHVRL